MQERFNSNEQTQRRVARHVNHLSASSSKASPVFGKQRPKAKFPQKGTPFETVVDNLRKSKENDAGWQDGKVPLFVFKGSTAAADMAKAAYNEFFTENALGAGRAFPSLKNMEEDLISMGLDLFHGPSSATGFVTTGGTESIISAVQTARAYARSKKKDPNHKGNLVLAYSAHPAFDKGAKLMDLEVRRIPVADNYRADVAAMAAAADENTIMMVGSAPCFPFGTFDPIAELAKVCVERKIWLHVDACVGGYLSPFVKGIGRRIPDWDFSVDGVVSISADLHKYGYAPKAISTVYYRSRKYARHHPFGFSEWPNGAFVTNTIVGTRAGGAVAGAWAVFHHLGREGYEAIARELMAAIDIYREGIERIPGLKVLGDPEVSIVAFAPDGTEDFQIFRIGEVMEQKGWLAGLLQNPQAIHRMMSMFHAKTMKEYVRDLEASVEQVRQESNKTAAKIKAKY